MKTDMELRQDISHAEKVVRHLRKQLRERKRKAHGEPKRKKGMGVRIGDRDDAEKVRRGYVEAGSYVRRDGSEKLAGRDWTLRKEELSVRARGQCEYQIALVGAVEGHFTATGTHVRCVGDGHDPHHIIKRSVRRDDRLTNLQLLCRKHHDALDSRKIRSGKVGA